MSFFKTLFRKLNVQANNNISHSSISIENIYQKESGISEIDFKVPSNKLYCITIESDEFTKDRIIKFKRVASYSLDKLLTWADADFIQLNIGFRNINGNNFISFSTYQKSLKFKKGDKIAFLFQDQEIKEFELLNGGQRIDKDTDGVLIESSAIILPKEIERFANIRTSKWRHIPCDDRLPTTGTIDYKLQNDFLEMTQVYKLALEIDI